MRSPDWELAGAVQRAVNRYNEGQNGGNVPPDEMVRLAAVIHVYRGRLTREQAIAEANLLAPASE